MTQHQNNWYVYQDFLVLKLTYFTLLVKLSDSSDIAQCHVAHCFKAKSHIGISTPWLSFWPQVDNPDLLVADQWLCCNHGF